MVRRSIGRSRKVVAAVLALALAVLPGLALAGTTGKIAGRIVDRKNKQPLEGVNIALPAARTGAVTDADGRYLVLNVPAGTYEAKVSLLGFRATTVTGVVVSADNTTALDLALEEAPVAMEEVVVSAERPVVDLKLTSNLSAVNREQLKALPVQELQDVVNLQAGVVDGHFRGGRVGEVQYQVDGVTVNNVYDNKSTLRIDRSLIEEVQVVSGTFDAEYGQAMSGVVNAVLRRGTDRFRWDAEVLNGSFAYAGGARRGIDYEFRPGSQENYQLTVSGPTKLPQTWFLANGRYYEYNDYVLAERRFSPWTVDASVRGTVPSPEWKSTHPDGDGLRTPLAYSREWSGIAKLTNRSLADVELNYQAVVNLLDTRRLEWAFRLDPDGLPTQRTRSVSHGLDVTHTLSRSTYYNVSFRQNWFDYRDRVYEDVWDPRYDLAMRFRPVAGIDYENGAYTQGVSFQRFRQVTDTYVLKSTFSSQLSRDQAVKMGAEFQWPFLRFGTPGYVVDAGDVALRIIDGVVYAPDRSVLAVVGETYFPMVRAYRPYVVGAFVQDDLEWNDLRLRAGARVDYFNSKAGLPSDLANPANSIAGAPLSTFKPATRKLSVSPRVGISYPVTKDAALFFAYGHFVQMPPLGDIFRNSDYGILANLQAGDADYGTVMGNPDIKPEVTVQYQFGYKQAVTDWLGVDVTAFYKDIRDLLGVEFVSTYNGAEYARLTNVDFGNVIGFTVAVDQRRRGLLSTSLDYTWQVAEGNSSDPRETATRAAAGADPRPRQVPFNWDQRHTLNATVSLSRDAAWNVSTVLRVASGQPYTPTREVGFGAGLETNSGRKPASFVADLRAERQVRLGGAGASVFGRVFNLFDTRYLNGFVFDTTGSPYYARDPARDENTLADPTRFYGPRRIEAGITVRMGE